NWIENDCYLRNRYLVGCQQPWCDDWAQDLALSINPQQKPCDDFYEFVCGNWNQSNVLPNSFLALQIRVFLSFFKRLILMDVKRPAPRSVSSHVKAAQLLQTCIQDAVRGVDNIDYVRQFMSQYNLSWPPDKRHGSPSMVDVLVELSLVRGIHLLFQLTPDVYFKKPGYYILHFVFSYQFIMEWMVLRKIIISEGRTRQFFEIMGELISGKTPDLQLIERVVFLDNTLLTAALPPAGDRPNTTSTYVRFSTLDNLTGSTSLGENMLRAVNRLLPPDRQMTDDDEIWVTHGGYLGYLGRLLGDDARSETLRGYVGLQLARYLSASASSRILKEQMPQRSGPMILMLSHCVMDAILTIPYVMGDLFVRWNLEERDLVEIRDMVTRVRNATRDGFVNLSWIDEATRTRALERIDHLGSLVGRPVNLSRTEQLEDHYSFLPVLKGSYAHMLAAIRDSESKRLRGLLKSSESYFPAINVELPTVLVNAFYVPVYHVMVIPPAILFAPFYAHSVPASFNYGSLGHVVGHEITHAFDPELSLYNASGIREDWWTSQSRRNFDVRVQCLKTFYNKVPWAGGVPYGDTAFSENFADCGGLEKVYRAFNSLGYQADHEIGDRKYSARQAFFINSCYKWCSREIPGSRTENSGDSVKFYSPMHMRCNVPLMNTPEFAAEFKCAEGTTMNPNQRCEVF
ncbi:neprilysin-1-like, partial [Ixodes scapularis]|uniref:neprilysin-1-like n=1 Tax=Ixodes scapularis TaxID=6945 RepID=UPI001C3857EC